METRARRRCARWITTAGLLLGLTAGGARAHAQTVTAVPKLDLARYMGQWYEISRYPAKAERKCLGDAFRLYALSEKDRRFQVVNSCRSKAAIPEIRNGNGKSQDKLGDGRLKVSYLFPFSSKQWVLALDPDYKWALVGSPNRKTLWILSRTKTLTPDVLTGIEAAAQAQGFNPAKLVETPQSR